ncbi:MAG: TolC family protein [Saprospiraceae bacterium]
MNHRQCLLLFGSWMLFFPMLVWSQPTDLTLEAAIQMAMTHNPEVQDARLKVLDAEARILESKSTGLPQVSASGSYQRYFKVPLVPLPAEFTGGEPQNVSFVLKNNLTGAVNVDAMVFDAAYLVALKASRAAREYAQLALADRQRQVRQSVRDVYLPLLFISENLVQLDKNIANLSDLYEETKAVYQAGFAEQLDVDRLELSLANLNTERSSLARQYENALNVLRFTLNTPSSDSLVIVDDMEALLAVTNEEMLMAQVDVSKRSETVLLDQALLLSDYNITAIRSRYLPSLRAFAGYQYQYQGNDFTNGFWAPTGFVGVSINLPIYDGGFKRSQVDRARISRDQVQLQRQTIERLIHLEVANARATVQNAKDRMAERERYLQLANRIFETTQIKYREGVGSSLEVNQAEQALYTAQSNLMQARYDLLKAQIDLAEALGLN